MSELNALVMIGLFLGGLWLGTQSCDDKPLQTVAIAELQGEMLVLNAKLDVCQSELDSLQDVETRNTKLEEACSATQSELNWVYYWRTLAIVLLFLLIIAAWLYYTRGR